jgi:hypothetical protein
MAHFAEINSNNKVLRVVVACNIDIENNGGERSEQAANAFKNVCQLSSDGVKWIQTSYNNNFRKKFAGVGDTYDAVKDIFWNENSPYSSWTLDSNYDWQPPIAKPLKNTWGLNNAPLVARWSEEKLNWVANGYQIEPSTIENPGTITPLVWNNTTKDWDLA